MTDRYVDPSVGSSGAGTSWAAAYKTLKEATDAAAAGEKIYFHNATDDVLTANTTYTLAAGVQIISTSDKTNSPPLTYATGAEVNSTTFGVDIVIAGRGAIFGVAFKSSTSGTATVDIASTDDDFIYAEDCTFAVLGGAGSLTLGTSSEIRTNAAVVTRKCTFLFGGTGQSITVGAKWQSYGDSFAPTGSVPTTLLGAINTNNAEVSIEGADLSTISGTLVVGNSASPAVVRFSDCKLHATVTPLGSTTSAASSEVYMYDCSYMNGSTLTGKLFYHENHLGSTTISTAIYNNSSTFTIDGTTKVSWVVDGKAASDSAQPYESPWLDVYHSGTSAITPSLEVMRDGSTTAYTDAEIWSEWQYKNTADSAKYTLVTDRVVQLASAANQTTGTLGAGDWSGETTPWYGKLESGSITPAEIGYIRARVCVVGNNTVYVDPQIYGLT